MYLWSELHSFSIKHLCFWVSPSGLSVCNSGIKDTLIVLWIELGGFSKFPGSLQIPFGIHQEESVMQMHRGIVWGHAICLREPRFSLRVPRFLKGNIKKLGMVSHVNGLTHSMIYYSVVSVTNTDFQVFPGEGYIQN